MKNISAYLSITYKPFNKHNTIVICIKYLFPDKIKLDESSNWKGKPN